ncbi:D-ribose pyranase [Fusibacter sp. 3D3]|uniref:D-ribose pyranase n=1 Tax=Fusibacter sp. 3D3 TaxID=1048380 RepID=UPI000853AE13|nr:D-ribose pyranase [Fusibacter sp. 3D3]GAU75852.1 ribose ABC transport system, high affinity permease RbsD [Fusibacter sp. 3D3]
MFKGKLLNSEVLAIVGKMGHTDMLVIGDAGLPIPKHVNRIDLALSQGIPSFKETLEVVLSSVQVEAVILAEELKTLNPEILNIIEANFTENQMTFVSHEDFKKKTNEARAVIRTGECTPFANIILVSGVTF